MKYTLYGSPRSRASRVLWMMRELGIDFEHVPSKAPSNINPNDKVPSLAVDVGGLNTFTLYESFAINLYLAKKEGSALGLAPRTIEEDGAMNQYSLWAITELEAPILSLLMKRVRGSCTANVAQHWREQNAKLEQLKESAEGKVDQ
eukprot:gene6108-2532_t